jgi:hypothetical protein
MISSRQTRSFLLLTSALALCASGAVADEDAPPAGPPASPDVGVVVRASDPRATLERRTKIESVAALGLPDLGIGGVESWTAECVAPCEARVRAGQVYRVAGAGLVPSEPLTFSAGSPVLVQADMGSADRRLLGIGLAGGGVAGLLLGTGALVATPILAHDDVGSPTLRTTVLASGVAVTTLSAFVLGAGLWLWSRNATHVQQDPLRGIAF